MAPYMSFPGCLGLLDSGSCLAKISQIRHFKGEQDGRQTPKICARLGLALDADRSSLGVPAAPHR
jgi:hypothetical protein